MTVTQEQDNGWRRWACAACEWATEWVAYTAPDHAASAIRHELEHRTAGKDIAL